MTEETKDFLIGYYEGSVPNSRVQPVLSRPRGESWRAITESGLAVYGEFTELQEINSRMVYVVYNHHRDRDIYICYELLYIPQVWFMQYGI